MTLQGWEPSPRFLAWYQIELPPRFEPGRPSRLQPRGSLVTVICYLDILRDDIGIDCEFGRVCRSDGVTRHALGWRWPGVHREMTRSHILEVHLEGRSVRSR